MMHARDKKTTKANHVFFMRAFFIVFICALQCVKWVEADGQPLFIILGLKIIQFYQRA
jgi:hypothetical protein